MGLKAERPIDTVYLWKLDDRAELDRLARELDQAVASKDDGSPRRVAGGMSVTEAAQAYDDYQVEAKERATKVEVRALRGSDWRKMVAAHPARPDRRGDPQLDDDGTVVQEGAVLETFPMDAIRGFNVTTMADDLVPESVPLFQFDGETDEEKQAERGEFLDDLADGAFSQIYSTAVRLNTDGGPDPKWSASSWAARMSAATSRSAEASA